MYMQTISSDLIILRRHSEREKGQAHHIEEGSEKRGTPQQDAERIAWATVDEMKAENKEIRAAGGGQDNNKNKNPQKKDDKKKQQHQGQGQKEMGKEDMER